LSIIQSKPDHLYANQSYFVSFPDVLDGSFDGGVEGSLVGESAIGEVMEVDGGTKFQVFRMQRER
jgi:hypothetical protein